LRRSFLEELPKHHEIKRVVLTPKIPDPSITLEYFNPLHWEDGPSRDDIIFPRGHWEMEVESGPNEKYTKLVELVGEDKALAVYELMS
jgi:hypothetical protein